MNRIRIALVLLVGAMLVFVAMTHAVLGADPRAALCPASAAVSVAHAFAMDHARDYHQRIPRMGSSPELDIDSPAYVVTYSGPVEIAVMGAADPQDENGNSIGTTPRTDKFTGVVCVVVNGMPTIYANVDTSGIQP